VEVVLRYGVKVEDKLSKDVMNVPFGSVRKGLPGDAFVNVTLARRFWKSLEMDVNE
jgi:hypothetical protein